MKRKITVSRKPVRAQQVPATVGMLGEMEDRLTEKMESGFQKLRSEIHGVKAEVQDLRSDLHGLKSEVHGIKSEVHGLKAEFHRIALLAEEQHARNQYVLDGYAQLYELIERKLG